MEEKINFFLFLFFSRSFDLELFFTPGTSLTDSLGKSRRFFFNLKNKKNFCILFKQSKIKYEVWVD